MNLALSIVGIVGGVMCAVADMLLDLKGRDNVKRGGDKVIESNWLKMGEWRFIVSIILAMVAVPMYSMGVISLGNQIGVENATLGNVLNLSIFIGAMGGFFIHSLTCITPIIYKEVMVDDNFALADRVIHRVSVAVGVPFGVLYLILMLAPSIIVGYAILAGLLSVPTWFVLLNPVCFQLIGLLLRAVKRDWFYDAPSIFMASLGLAMFGVVGIVNAL